MADSHQQRGAAKPTPRPADLEAAERDRLSQAIADAQRTLFELASETAKRKVEAKEAEAEADLLREYATNVAMKLPSTEPAAASRSSLQAAAFAVSSAMAPPST